LLDNTFDDFKPLISATHLKAYKLRLTNGSWLWGKAAKGAMEVKAVLAIPPTNRHHVVAII
jgi:hypothetical protein